MSDQTWLVLGGSSPIARAFAAEVARRGDAVLLAGRDQQDLDAIAADLRIRTSASVGVVHFDATAFDTHDAFVAQVRELATGTLNVFVAVGVMPSQAEADADFDVARRMIDTNYTGVVSVLSHLTPLLEAQGAGRVVALGSVAGDRGRQRNYLYGSTKAALHVYLQGLRARLGRAGISVTTIKPGFIDTSMTWAMPRRLIPFASPESLARAALRYAERGVGEKYYPWFWWPIMTVIKLLPEFVVKRLRV